MKVTIVVPHYKESWAACHYLFDSLKVQRGIDFTDFNVCVVNDGREELGIVGDYPFDIKQITPTSHGVSGARNCGLDNADGDYVMFCDCDDMFLNAYGMFFILKSIDKEEPDVIVSPFVEEQPHQGTWVLIQHDNKDCTFVHGKAFRKAYLTEVGHRFDESLTIHEDGYFVSVALTLTQKVSRITTPVYLWRWNEGSVVRSSHDRFVLKTYRNVIDGRLAICREMKRRNLENEFYTALTKTITDCYYDFQFGDFRKKENAGLIRKAEKQVQRFWQEFGADFKKAPEKMIGEVVQISRQNAYQKGFRLEKETLKDFIKRVCEGKCPS